MLLVNITGRPSGWNALWPSDIKRFHLMAFGLFEENMRQNLNCEIGIIVATLKRGHPP